MARGSLVRGMGSFFKECEHPQSRSAKCSHPYKIRYRSVAGKQVEESGFADRDKAIGRLTEIYNEKKTALQSQSKKERLQKYGTMRFKDYVEAWKAGQRHLAVASVRHLDSLLEHHLSPALGSRRMNSFDQKVVDGFIRTMERNGAGLATQSNALDKLRAILLGASVSSPTTRWPGSSRRSTTPSARSSRLRNNSARCARQAMTRSR